MVRKLEGERHIRAQAAARKHEKERNSIVEEMEREFEEIFGEDRSRDFSQYFDELHAPMDAAGSLKNDES